MANFGDLLGNFMRSGVGQSGQVRAQNALRDLQAGLGSGQGGQGGAGGLLGGLLDAAKGGLSSASQNPLQAGGLGAVLGSVLGGGGDSVKGALTGGALAMLAGVAFKALSEAGQAAGAGGPGAAVPAGTGGAAALPLGLKAPESPAERQVLDNKARLILKGMINIAKSDGQVGLDELQRIIGKAEAAGLDDEGKDWLMAELARPLDLSAFVAEIPDQETAAEVYAASLLAVEVDTPEERDYLRQLAERTRLHPIVVQHIHQTMGVAA